MDSQNIPCATLKRSGSWVISVYASLGNPKILEQREGVVPEMWVLCGRGWGSSGLAGGGVLVAAVPALRDPVAHVVDGDAVA